ncbi:helix-turn-helix domain-containing protein [Nocardioides sp. GXQ0305]|uniref:helix-turn-helix domain-containing protein n=1 Tax=Nocardioides sp. GXQ0305 TaxID=3423912 RepID=UPI003D7DB0DE
MNLADSALLQEIRPYELGSRLRAARLARGWTQTDLAGDLVSVGYVSRLESGHRRPNAEVLEALAQRLGVSIDMLLRGATAPEQDELRLALDFAELSLENGEHAEAEVRAREARDRAVAIVHHDLADRATYLVARALESQGNVDDAILELETIVSSGGAIPLEPGAIPRAGVVAIPRIQAAIALSRCYRESGDLSLAIEAGERVLAELEGSPLDSSDEAVQLSVTIALAYQSRGDTGQAIRICRRAIAKAEKLNSPKARAAAYWNASLFESDRGSVAEAIPLAERALALLAEGQDGRNLARLRTALADMQLQLDPPDVDAALAMLDLAAEELAASSGGVLDIARNDIARARALLLAGDLVAAHELGAVVHAKVAGQSPLAAADAKLIEGQAAAAAGRPDDARAAYRDAVLQLTGVGADRDAADLWFELAGLLEALGDLDAARDAYRSAAASTGLRARTAIPMSVNVSSAIP